MWSPVSQPSGMLSARHVASRLVVPYSSAKWQAVGTACGSQPCGPLSVCQVASCPPDMWQPAMWSPVGQPSVKLSARNVAARHRPLGQPSVKLSSRHVAALHVVPCGPVSGTLLVGQVASRHVVPCRPAKWQVVGPPSRRLSTCRVACHVVGCRSAMCPAGPPFGLYRFAKWPIINV